MKRQITKRGLSLSVVLLVVVPLLLLLSCQVIITLATSEISKSENPPTTLQESDVVGTWQANYGGYAVDKLIVRADGTFKQIYKNRRENYIFETPWNKWWLERFADGRVRLHLKGARYYLSGIPLAEEEGVVPTSLPVTGGEPKDYYDPFDPERRYYTVSRYHAVSMVRKLVLNVRLLPSGELVLAHMWPSSESPLGDTEVFHRVETPSPLETPVP